ncbi:MAG: aminotransferase class I/II-fold pyridoxal phosphate-dependent enzyme, partial [Bacteroidales bacterium]|nr:aminotransferase class I/II-fold pyridoxal phosphate-dependent enzyme [Bacteroidales bacterium]
DLCNRFDGIVVVDEAYIDFSAKGSALTLLDDAPNLIVLQTLSKAWGSAAARLGIAFASAEIIAIFNKVKYPYNISLLTQRYALERLDNADDVQRTVCQILADRTILTDALAQLPIVRKIYPTDANFVLVDVGDATAVYNYLCDNGIVVRNRTNVAMCLGCLRITVGTAQENQELIKALYRYGK